MFKPKLLGDYLTLDLIIPNTEFPRIQNLLNFKVLVVVHVFPNIWENSAITYLT